MIYSPGSAFYLGGAKSAGSDVEYLWADGAIVPNLVIPMYDAVNPDQDELDEETYADDLDGLSDADKNHLVLKYNSVNTDLIFSVWQSTDLLNFVCSTPRSS